MLRRSRDSFVVLELWFRKVDRVTHNIVGELFREYELTSVMSGPDINDPESGNPPGEAVATELSER